MKKLITQNRGLSQKQAISSKIQVDTPTFTPVSNTFSQILNEFPENPEKEQKNQQQSMDITQQNLLNESDGEWNRKPDQSQIKFSDARVIQFPYQQRGEDQLNKDDQLLISDGDGYNDLIINSQLYHSEPENAQQIQKFTQYEVKNQNQIHISNQKLMHSSTVPQSLNINSSYPPQALSVPDENAYQIQDGHIFSKEQLNIYNQKYLQYQTLVQNQAQYIKKLHQQVSWNRQQLQSFKVTCQAKMEACLEVKELEILRLKQQIVENRKCIQKLEQKIKVRAKMPNIVIEQYEIQSKIQLQKGEDIQNIVQQNNKIKFELSQSIRQSNNKICTLTQQIKSLKYLNSELKAHLNILQTENRQIKHEISEINNRMIMRQNKVKKIMQKQLSKIRGLGAQMIGIAESQLHSHKKCKQTKYMQKSTHGEDHKIK